MKTGEFTIPGLGDKAKGIFGFSIKALGQDQVKVEPFGNIRETSFAAMAASEAMAAFVAARPAFCTGCALETECLGGCKAAAEACTGCVSAMDPFLAAFRHLAEKPR